MSLNLAAYHFRVLAKYGVIESVEENPRRGALERVDAINPNSPVPDVMHLGHLLQQIVEPRTYSCGRDADDDGLAIASLDIDDEGREELKEVLAELKVGLGKVAQKCRERLRPSKTSGDRLPVGCAAVRSATGRQQRVQVLLKADAQ